MAIRELCDRILNEIPDVIVSNVDGIAPTFVRDRDTAMPVCDWGGLSSGADSPGPSTDDVVVDSLAIGNWCPIRKPSPESCVAAIVIALLEGAVDASGFGSFRAGRNRCACRHRENAKDG